MQTKTKLFMTIIFIFLNINSWSQNFISDTSTSQSTEKKGFELSRFFFGGNIGFMLGDYTNIELSPLVGYHLTKRLSLATQVKYNYVNSKHFSLSFSNYGFALSSSYNITKQIFAHVEYEYLSIDSKLYNLWGLYTNEKRIAFHNILVGGGYRTPIGERSYANLLILWNISDNAYSLYNNPIIRINFEF